MTASRALITDASDPTHYLLVTSAGRPFLSMALCDGQHTMKAHVATPDWSRVTCSTCLELGPEAGAALLALPDSALIALGAWHERMDEPTFQRKARA